MSFLNRVRQLLGLPVTLDCTPQEWLWRTDGRLGRNGETKRQDIVRYAARARHAIQSACPAVSGVIVEPGRVLVRLIVDRRVHLSQLAMAFADEVDSAICGALQDERDADRARRRRPVSEC